MGRVRTEGVRWRDGLAILLGLASLFGMMLTHPSMAGGLRMALDKFF
jgi:hypothetical protein